MKKYKFPISTILFLVLLFLLVCFPKICINGAKTGLLLWFQTILPVLFPFMITVRMMEDLNVTQFINRFFSPVFSKIFSVSKNSSFPIITGFLCGFPLGAKNCAEYVEKGKISKEEGQYLLSFCNNSSPSFLTGYLTVVLLGEQGFQYLAIIFLAAVITGRISYTCYYKKRLQKVKEPALSDKDTSQETKNPSLSDKGTSRKTKEPSLSDKKKHVQTKSSTRTKSSDSSFVTLLDKNIMSCAEVLLKVGSYMMLFSVLSQLMFHAVLLAGHFLPKQLVSLSMILCGTLEVTNGTSFVCEAVEQGIVFSGFFSPPQLKIVLTVMLTAFGGFSAIAQTQSVINTSGLSIRNYIFSRIINTCVAGILCILFIYWRHFNFW